MDDVLSDYVFKLTIKALPTKSNHLNLYFIIMDTEEHHDYKIKDISLWEYGRKEIDLAEVEMPGLMAAREEYGPP